MIQLRRDRDQVVRVSKTTKDNKKAKAKRMKPRTRLTIPPNKRHKSKRDYKRKKKVDPNEYD